MTVSQQKIDSWFLKGLDGLCAHIEIRSKDDNKIFASYLKELEKALDKIDVAIRYESNVDKENPDLVIFSGLSALTDLLIKRCCDQVRELEPDLKQMLRSFSVRLSQALTRFRNKVDG